MIQRGWLEFRDRKKGRKRKSMKEEEMEDEGHKQTEYKKQAVEDGGSEDRLSSFDYLHCVHLSSRVIFTGMFTDKP